MAQNLSAQLQANQNSLLNVYDVLIDIRQAQTWQHAATSRHNYSMEIWWENQHLGGGAGLGSEHLTRRTLTLRMGLFMIFAGEVKVYFTALRL